MKLFKQHQNRHLLLQGSPAQVLRSAGVRYSLCLVIGSPGRIFTEPRKMIGHRRLRRLFFVLSHGLDSHQQSFQPNYATPNPIKLEVSSSQKYASKAKCCCHCRCSRGFLQCRGIGQPWRSEANAMLDMDGVTLAPGPGTDYGVAVSARWSSKRPWKLEIRLQQAMTRYI